MNENRIRRNDVVKMLNVLGVTTEQVEFLDKKVGWHFSYKKNGVTYESNAVDFKDAFTNLINIIGE